MVKRTRIEIPITEDHNAERFVAAPPLIGSIKAVYSYTETFLMVGESYEHGTLKSIRYDNRNAPKNWVLGFEEEEDIGRS